MTDDTKRNRRRANVERHQDDVREAKDIEAGLRDGSLVLAPEIRVTPGDPPRYELRSVSVVRSQAASQSSE